MSNPKLLNLSLKSVFVYWNIDCLSQNEPTKQEMEKLGDIYEHSEIEAVIPFCNNLFMTEFIFSEKPDERKKKTEIGKKPDHVYFDMKNPHNLIEVEHKRVFLPSNKYTPIHNTTERIYKYLISKLKTNGLFMDLRYLNPKTYNETKNMIEAELNNVILTNFEMRNEYFELRVCPIADSLESYSSVLASLEDKNKGFLVMYHHSEAMDEMIMKLTVDSLLVEIKGAIEKTRNVNNSKFKKDNRIIFSTLLCSLTFQYGFELFFEPEARQLSFEDLITKVRYELEQYEYLHEKIDIICLKKDYNKDIYMLYMNNKWVSPEP
ncbi:hypothetical protein [Desulfosporosinus lacus]|uniref:Uncharacterized protein n=1 Tax=Desulfosporosinus lacus DSM 15449 TaxID=1121420 RepID=A0A1M5Q9P3_9FIRM|nr:hypothetical protein [Desulfosporosinus lacus]SHH10884.1 hypothetical protein SAMN02746098_00188 [Desulfosporosinus lacus DSM 15449]